MAMLVAISKIKGQNAHAEVDVSVYSYDLHIQTPQQTKKCIISFCMVHERETEKGKRL